MKGIKIINPGMLSTIQDSGRTGYREFGLPVSGVMDTKAFHLANWLVRNDMNEGVIETTFPGLEIEFMSGTVFSITGGDMSPLLNDKVIRNWKSYKTKTGMRLSLSRLASGSRSYISFSGGFRIDPQLGSLATYIPGKLGGYRGRALESGDIIPLFPGIPFLFKERKVPDDIIPEYRPAFDLRVVPGVDFELFSSDTKRSFLESEYKVTNRSDRMGFRLEGQSILPERDEQIVSYGIHPGTIQIPGDGKPIIMGSDCQTVGGYPQIANIISADLPYTGQLKPGDKIRFRLVNNNEALELLKIYNNRINSLFGKSKGTVCTDCFEKRR